MIDKNYSVLNYLIEYRDLQTALCHNICNFYNLKNEMDILYTPKKGSISVGNVLWEFKRHGLGLEFKRSHDGCIVDAHTMMVSEPSMIDSYRLSLYLESLGLESIIYEERIYDVRDEGAIRELFKHLLSKGFLRPHDAKPTLYEIVD